jgi:hypothetical protein
VLVLPSQLGRHVVAEATAEQFDGAQPGGQATPVGTYGELDGEGQREHRDERVGLGRGLGPGRSARAGLLAAAASGHPALGQERERDGVHASMTPAEASIVPGRPDGGRADVDGRERTPQLDITARILDRKLVEVGGQQVAGAALVVQGDETRRYGGREHGRVSRVVAVDRHRVEQVGEHTKHVDVAGRAAHVDRERGIEELVTGVGVRGQASVCAQLLDPGHIAR